ncbi:hypothetical protein IPM62_02410 [Candidatus Woesebacteria bacterium]|nr:MAG: hypothetical protein IPM62_02410 [Candidatus Woesebacteria bacterium]
MINKSPFIVIEGPDGSGKGTQHALLIEKLKENERKVFPVDFPQYYNHEGYFGPMIGRMLKGDFGPMDIIDPRLASVLFAMDRWEASENIRTAQRNGLIVVGNRYTLSNEAHQVARMPPSERDGFLADLRKMEYDILKIPRPDLYLFLSVPFEISQKLIEKKAGRNYLGGAQKDGLEKDVEHQLSATRLYGELAKNDSGIVVVDCASESGTLMSIEEVHGKVWKEVDRFIHQYEEG